MQLAKTLQTAATIQKLRSAAKDIWGSEYAQKISKYKTIIKAHMMLNKQTNHLQAATDILARPEIKGHAGTEMMFIAAAADLIDEPVIGKGL